MCNFIAQLIQSQLTNEIVWRGYQQLYCFPQYGKMICFMDILIMERYWMTPEFLCAISVQGTEPPNTEKPGWWDPPGSHRIKTHIHRDSQQGFPAPTWLEGRHSGDCGLWVTHLPADGGYYLLLDMFLDMYFLDREINKKKMTINTIIYWILRMRQDYA